MNRSVRRLASVVAVAALAGVACGSDDDPASDDDPVATEGVEESGTAPAPASDTQPATSDVASGGSAVGDGLEVTMVSLAESTAVLTNTGSEPFDLTGHWVCNRPSYAELPARELAAGESIEIGVGGITEGGGEVAIYSSDTFSSSDDIVAYVHWGDGGGRSAVAEEAGIWSGAPVEPAGDTIELVGDAGSAAGWT